MEQKFLPLNQYDLIRIGSKNDGGYLVERNSLENSTFLIGLGINDDWNFELGFGKPFIGIDNVISNKFLLKRLIIKVLILLKNPFQLESFQNLINHVSNFAYYIKHKYCFRKILISNYDSKTTLSLDSVLSDYKSNIFLKVDIEGSEYRIIEQILQNEKIIEGLVIEFHDVDLHYERIISFIDRSSLSLVHFHPNNCGGIDENGNPLVIELTFSKNPKIITKGSPELPLDIDRPNNPSIDDIITIF